MLVGARVYYECAGSRIRPLGGTTVKHREKSTVQKTSKRALEDSNLVSGRC